MSDLKTAEFDVVVVGAGPQGLVAAKTFLQLSPKVNLLIIDSNQSVGGVWAKENIYPDLKANNQLGTFEFTDFNFLDVCPGKMRHGEHIPGEAAHEYFHKYAQHFDLLRRVRFGHKVVTAEHLPGHGGGWELTVVRTTDDAGNHDVNDSEKSQKEVTTTIATSKLIVATGLTSTPMPISISGTASFSPPLLAFGDFRRGASRLLEDPNIKHIAVYGSAKSAYDAVYAFATRSIQVTWILRESGHGPVWMTKSHIYLGPIRAWIEELVTIRPFTWLSPCIWGDNDGFGPIRRLLHQTSIGQWIVGAFWNKLGGDILAQTGLRDKGPEVEKLVPKEGAMWYGTSFSILNYDTDIHKFVQDGTVKIVKRDIDRLDGKNVIFKTAGLVEKSDRLDVDALICSKGWRWDSGIDFLPKTEHADLGIPSADYTPAQTAQWSSLEAQADEEILERFPMLAHGPGIHDDARVIPKPKDPSATEEIVDEKPYSEPEKQRKEELTPWRLFRGIAPPANPRRDLVFLGMMSSLQTVVRSELSALWAYAYLNDKLSALAPLSYRSPSPQQHSPVEKDVKDPASGSSSTSNAWLYDSALLSRFGRWRFPMGYGARFPDYVFDGVPYWDLLMRDLGLRSWRKGWGWVGEVFGGAYMRAEYKGVVDEWRGKGRA